jgi:YVTN family beta-propeller protein
MPASPIHSSLRNLSIAVLAWMAFAAITVAAAVLTQRAPDVVQPAQAKSTKAGLVTSLGPRQSSPVALSGNNQILINVNPESNSVSVFDVTADTPRKVAEVGVGVDPSSVAIHPDGTRAYVANSYDGTVSIIDLTYYGVATTLNVGVEPMALALSPNGTRLYVANSASNNLMVVDTTLASPAVIATVDLSAVGTAPRAIAVTNSGDASDADETVFVALFYGQLRPGKTAVHEGQDDQREGRVAAISAATNAIIGTTALAPMANTGFNANGQLAPGNGLTPATASTNPQTFTTPTGAYPNQLASVAIQPGQNRAYVVSTAASPNGPFRFNHMAQGLVSAFDTSTRAEITAAQTDTTVRRTAPLNLNQGINLATTPAPRLFMTNPVGMTWRPNGSDAWIVVQQADLIVRVTVDGSGIPTINAPLAAGPSSIVRVDLQAVAAGQIQGKAPQGIAINSTGTRAYVYNFISRSISTIDISNPTAPAIAGTAAATGVPNPASAAGIVHLGAELFFSGRGPQGRMSSEAWGGCVVCHPKGRSDNVTWMFDAGPRQTIPLDGMFNKLSPHDQRILNWSAVRDENQDFELNTRGVFGGRGLIDDDRLFFAAGGTNATPSPPAESALIEQFNNFTGTVSTANDLVEGAVLPGLPGTRRDFAIATLGDDRVLIIGGRSGPGVGSLVTGANAVLEFNPRTNAIIPRSSSGFTPRHSFGAVAVQTNRGARVYAVGGYSSTATSAAPVGTVEEFNPFNNTWRTVAPLPTAVAQFGIAAAGGINTAEPLQLVHVVSGNTGSEAAPSVANSNPVQRFQADPIATGTWSVFNPAGLSLRRNHGIATALRGVSSRIFVIGGQDAAGAVLDTVEEYVAQTVAMVASAHSSLPGPRARFGIGSTVSSNQIYVVGGIDGAGADQTTVLEYTVATQGATPGAAGTPSGTWTTRGNLSAARSGLQLSNPPGVTNFLPFANSGRDPDQDAIAKYVATIRSAQPPVSGSSPSAQSGKTLFNQVGLVVPDFSCATCHGGPKFTRSTVGYTGPPSPDVGLGLGNQRVVGAELRQNVAQGSNAGQFPGVLINVGTFAANAAGGRVNEIRANGADLSQAIAPLGANGFNIPSLLSVHETAPYYYSGLAQTLEEVLNGSQDGNGGVRHHFVANAAQRADLVSYLKSIGPEAGPALPAVVEFYNAPLDNFFITADPVEAAAVDTGNAGPGWSRTGNIFLSGGPIAVCRFYGSLSPGPNSHFYTASASECAFLRALQATTPPTVPRWNFESNDFLTNVPLGGACPAQTVPVFRAYNDGLARHIDSNHRITNNAASIQEVVARGWTNEGVVMCAPQ